MPERLRDLRSWLTANPANKALSLAIAVATWAFVQQAQVHSGRVKVGLDVVLPEGLLTVDPMPTRASLLVEGPRSMVRRTQFDDSLMMRIDLSEADIGLQEVALSDFVVRGLPSSLTVVETTPNALRVQLDERGEKSVAVEMAPLGDLAKGHRLVDARPDPAMVVVSGPRSVLMGLDAVSTAPLDVSAVSESTALPIDLVLPSNVMPAERWEGMANLMVESVDSTLNVSGVPVLVWERHMEYTPAATDTRVQLELEGPSEVLRNISLDEVVAFVYLPEGADEGRYEASYQASSGARLEVIFPRKDVIRVATPPKDVVVVKR